MTCLLGFILSVLATMIPSLIAITIVWWLDRYEKEPLWLLSIIFFWGAIPTVILALIAQVVLDVPISMIFGNSILYSVASLSIVAPLTEEIFKALIILIIFVVYRQEFDGIMDGILYGVLVGFGFSVVEDVLYLMSSLMESGWGEWGVTAAMRVGLYNLNHSMFAACSGIGFGLARNTRQMWKRFLYPVLGLSAAVLLHGIHNGGLVIAEQTQGLSCLLLTLIDWMGIAAMLVLIFVSVRRESRWFDELLPEVENGVITADEYQIASNYKARLSRGWHMLVNHGLRTWMKWSRSVQMIVDLAYKKHQREAAGEGAKTDQRIAHLREQILRLRQELPNGESSFEASE